MAIIIWTYICLQHYQPIPIFFSYFSSLKKIWI